jgi:hypothetical protein
VWVPKTSSTSCDLRVFIDDAAKAIAPVDVAMIWVHRFREASELAGVLKRPVWSMPVVVLFVLGQDTPQVRQIPDKSPIQDRPAAGADPVPLE